MERLIKFEVWINRRTFVDLGRSKFELSSAREMFCVWGNGPYSTNLFSQKAVTFLLYVVVDDSGNFLLPDFQTINVDVILNVFKGTQESVHFSPKLSQPQAKFRLLSEQTQCILSFHFMTVYLSLADFAKTIYPNYVCAICLLCDSRGEELPYKNDGGARRTF